MSTNVTPDAFLAALTRWGVRWRFYKDRADWLTHNRNAKNLDLEPDGFGPLRGVVAHNTASTAQAGMVDYLYRGDSARRLPGPLAHGAILKTGEVVLLGWGTTNHAGPSDPAVEAKARADALPLTSELRPTTSGPDDPRARRIAPYYLGFEACHASEGATAAQYAAEVAFTCACLDVMGGPANGYGAGSVLMHRELTTTRSDPQGVPRDGKFRRDVAARLKAGPPSSTPATKPPVAPAQKPTTCVVSLSRSRITEHAEVLVAASVSPAVPGVFRFDWSYPGRNEWTPFGGDQKSTTGRAQVTSTPGSDIVYRARFYPTDSKAYAADWSPNVALDVVTLADYDAAQKTIADLRAQLAAATKPPAT